MTKTEREFPLKIAISFKKLFESYQKDLESGTSLQKERAKAVLGLEKNYPKLSSGFSTAEEIKELKPQIDFVLDDLFSSVLQPNEIKIAAAPFASDAIKSTARYDRIMENKDSSEPLKLSDMTDDQFYIIGCSLILNSYYGYKIDFRRPYFYEIPNADGITKYYKILYNADFGYIEKGENSIEITEEDVLELLDNFDNIDMWKEKFPPNSWNFYGFVIANMYDATLDVVLSNFKTNLLSTDNLDVEFVSNFEEILRSLYSIKDIKIGFTLFNEEKHNFEDVGKSIESYILIDNKHESCTTALCDASYYTLFKKREFYCISDVEYYKTKYPENRLYSKLSKQNIGSAVIVPIVTGDELYGVMEIVSNTPKALNSINSTKLHDILPYLIDSVKRSKESKDNAIELMIQEECTAIHPSVHWKFRQEAERVIKAQSNNNQAFFKELVFDDVYPLYGQIDIKGSSEARNEATKKDLVLQLQHIKKIIKKIYLVEKLHIYEHFDYRVDNFLLQIEDDLQVNSENDVLQFVHKEINPLFKHLSKKNEGLKELVNEYDSLVDSETGLVYKNRKDYDESVMLINKKMAAIIDRHQIEAQEMYPHYYERFKTDGIEHNLYIGESITKKKSFNKI